MSHNQGRPTAGDSGPEPRDATRLESDQEIRQALQARRARLAARAPAAGKAGPVKVSAPGPAEVEAQAERPVQRPPTAMLCILDDGKIDGEWVRLRADRTVIGRTDGEIRIPHDGQVSGRHAEIVRQRGPKGWRWLLVDLQSTNGTFVRIGSSLLQHGNELLIGAGRYRFEAAAGPPGPAAPGAALQPTQAWSNQQGGSLVPSLVETTAAGPVQRFSLMLPEYWVGRDPQSYPIARPNDVLVNARHARLYRDAGGQWHIENNKSLNGLWLRVVEPMPLGGGCQFRAGEQRFLFRGK
ncbi:MAG TPA: FHA domain-containing protein [Gemmataceae bacterium]|nr:FHA domain-containing protein [Gemmataceae bacterium]